MMNPAATMRGRSFQWSCRYPSGCTANRMLPANRNSTGASVVSSSGPIAAANLAARYSRGDTAVE